MINLDQAKPNGVYELKTEDVQEYMASVSLSDLPGVGWRLGGKLKEKGFTKCSELWGIPCQVLQVERWTVMWCEEDRYCAS